MCTIKDMWILRNAKTEISSFYGLSLLLIATSFWWYNKKYESMIAIAVAVGIDNSHVYATAWRSWLDRKELSRARWLHLWTPIGLVLVIFLWCAFGIPGFWSFVLYFTVFHHIRQFFGIHRWSLALNPTKRIDLGRELYLFTTLPFIGYHFRDEVYYSGFFTPTDMWRYPNETLLWIVCGALILTTTWTIYKLWANRQQFSFAVVSTLLFPAMINIYCFLIVKEFLVTLLPILAVHGVSYFHLTNKAQARTKGGFWRLKPLMGFFAIVLFSVCLGSLEAWFTQTRIYLTPSRDYYGHLAVSLGVAVATMPALYHYVADAFLWKRTHPDFKRIIGP